MLKSAFLALLLAPLPSFASTHRVVVLSDPATDYALRLQLIDEAAESVDLAIFHHTADESVGRPLLDALRDASRRGVRVRMLGSFFAAEHSASHKLIPLLLNDASLGDRSQAILFGQWLKSPLPGPHAKMWTTFDEKFMVVDGDKAVVGGRGVGAEYLHWKDTDLYLEGPATAGLTELFERIWLLANKHYPKRLADPANTRAERREQARPRVHSPLLAAAAEGARTLRAQPGYAPASVQVLHNDVIARMDEGRAPKDDPVLERFIALTRTASNIRFYSLYTIQDERARQALLEARARGARVEILTNSLEAAKALSSIPWPYQASVPNQLALVRGGVTIHQWQPEAEWDFLHQKLGVFDDTVLFGSHNFNWSSSHNYDQAELEIRDAGLADELARRFDAEAARYARPATESLLRAEAKRDPLGMLMSRWFIGLY